MPATRPAVLAQVTVVWPLFVTQFVSVTAAEDSQAFRVQPEIDDELAPRIHACPRR